MAYDFWVTVAGSHQVTSANYGALDPDQKQDVDQLCNTKRRKYITPAIETKLRSCVLKDKADRDAMVTAMDTTVVAMVTSPGGETMSLQPQDPMNPWHEVTEDQHETQRKAQLDAGGGATDWTFDVDYDGQTYTAVVVVEYGFTEFLVV